jgi:uncharacterized DUF497 family protein
MMFDWDDDKSERNLRCRGFDFEYAGHVFDGKTEEFVDGREDYGETRVIAFGHIEGRLYAVVYTQRGETRWIISAFRCKPKELRRWKRRAAAF